MYLQRIRLWCVVAAVPQVRRFVTLVDELYEHGTSLSILCDCHPGELFDAVLPPAERESLNDPHFDLAALDADLPSELRSTDSSVLSTAVEDVAITMLRFAVRRARSRLVQVRLLFVFHCISE